MKQNWIRSITSRIKAEKIQSKNASKSISKRFGNRKRNSDILLRTYLNEEDNKYIIETYYNLFNKYFIQKIPSEVESKISKTITKV